MSHRVSYSSALSMTIIAQGAVAFNYIILKNLIPHFLFALLAALSLARLVSIAQIKYTNYK